MKSVKAFSISIVLFTIGILVIDWARNYFYHDQNNSPLIRIKTLFVIIVGSLIMKKFLTTKGFKIFLFGYFGLWLLQVVFGIMANHIESLFNSYLYYKDKVELISPLPFIFFGLLDRIFLMDAKKE